jgi:multiple sugar transport system permease protein
MKKYGKVLLFLLPALAPIVMLWLWPIISTARLSTTDWDYISPTYNYVGFDNYAYMFKSPVFLRALGVTAVFTIFSLVISMTIGLLLAMAIYRNRHFNWALKFMYFSPWVTPIVAVSIVWVFMFDKSGIINYVGGLLGLARVDWLGNSATALIPIIVVTVWTNLGWNMIFYLGALSKIPKDLYEAANIDGVSRMSRLRHIILPLVSPTTLFLTVLNTINFLQAYAQIDIMTRGGPAESTQTLLYLFYKYAFSYLEVGRASSVALILVGITAVLSALQFWIGRKHVYYS